MVKIQILSLAEKICPLKNGLLSSIISKKTAALQQKLCNVLVNSLPFQRQKRLRQIETEIVLPVGNHL